jgi:peroxiredoxin
MLIDPPIGICAFPLTVSAATGPQLGDKAPNFSLNTLDDQKVQFSDLTAKSTVVLIELRG